MKLALVRGYVIMGTVAPYVGAWIETALFARASPVAPVAPYVGAWIETITPTQNHYAL